MADYTKRDGQIPSRFVLHIHFIVLIIPYIPKNILLLHQSLGCYSDNVTFDSIR